MTTVQYFNGFDTLDDALKHAEYHLKALAVSVTIEYSPKDKYGRQTFIVIADCEEEPIRNWL